MIIYKVALINILFYSQKFFICFFLILNSNINDIAKLNICTIRLNGIRLRNKFSNIIKIITKYAIRMRANLEKTLII